MDPKITVAIITAAATLLAALIGKIPLEKGLSYWRRRESGIPKIMGTKWKAEWKYEDGSPLPNDTVTFSNWTKNNLFEGFGEITYEKLYKYLITGEVSPRVVVLTYKAEGYPTESNIGTACLLLSPDGQELSGTWVGYEGEKQNGGTYAFKLRGGNVAMRKVKDSSR